jgi:hypothetical protein
MEEVLFGLLPHIAQQTGGHHDLIMMDTKEMVQKSLIGMPSEQGSDRV